MGEERNMLLGVLVRARALISSPDRWLSKCPSPHEEGRGQFCAARAIWSQGEYGYGHITCVNSTLRDAYDLICLVADVDEIPAWNDASTHAEVLAAFDLAIARAEGRND